MADEVLQQGVRGITDLMVMPGLINLDFADVRSVMGEMGKAMMGTGEADGENRAIEAAEKAIANPLLDGVSMKGAKGVIISITGGEDMRLMEVDEAASHIKELVDPDANIIWGSAFNNSLDGKIRVSVVATGIEADSAVAPEPARVFAFPAARKMEELPEAKAAPAYVAAPAPIMEMAAPLVLEEPVAETADIEEVAEIEAETPHVFLDDAVLELDDSTAEPVDMIADSPDELMLDSGTMLDTEVTGNPIPPAPATDASDGHRRWMVSDEAEPEPEPAPAQPAPRVAVAGGTLFERMSNIARGAAKGDQEAGTADPLDIPRFLNRQNNQ